MAALASSLLSAPTLPLNDIQGNLLGFFKPFQRFVFFSFRDKSSAQGFIRVVIRYIDTVDDVVDFRDRLKWNEARERPLPKSRWFNLLLSARGLGVIEAPDRALFEQAFRDGMRARAETLGDVDLSRPDLWDSPFQGEIHAMAILAADDVEGIEALHISLRRHANAAAHPVDELGQVDGQARTGEHHGREHFGFTDGVSQPGVQGLPGGHPVGQDNITAGEFLFGHPRQDEPPQPSPPPGYQAPTPAAQNFPSWAREGSLVVFRRLRQDVKGFNDFVAQTSLSTGLRPDLLEAKMVGRYKSGAPLERTRDQADTLDPETEDPSVADPTIIDANRINNFDFEPHDVDGHLVPRAAHIRKAYPRNQNPPGKPDAERRRILRRGITYGSEFLETESPYPGTGSPPAEQDRGLLFVCYQASIERQFEFIQTQWANSDDFPQPADGRDPIISQDEAAPTFAIPPTHLHLVLQRWVITTGGEYFISPSVTALRTLSDTGSTSA